MSWALADAAADAGIGLTILPVLYERAGFAADACATISAAFARRRRRRSTAAQRIRAAARPLVDSGLAIHSLRAASAASIAALATLADGFAGPIHIHVAEQTGEVDECIARDRCAADRMARSRRTARRALAARPRDARDARRRSPRSRRAAPASSCARAPRPTSATACATCPAGSTPACRSTIGSDSQATRDWREELRLLEYGQRLARRAAQRRGGAGARRRVERRAALRAHARRRRGRGRPADVGPRRRRARRCARRRSARRCAARRRAGAIARRARLQQPERAVARRDGRRPLGDPRRRPRERAAPIGERFAAALGRARLTVTGVRTTAARRGSLADRHPGHLEPVVGAVDDVDVARAAHGITWRCSGSVVTCSSELAQRRLDQLLALLRIGLGARLRRERVELVVASRGRSCRSRCPSRRGSCASPASASSRRR